jgi:hypothetical protein
MKRDEESIPTLTDVVPVDRQGRLSPQAVADLQAALAARVERLADELVHDASREIEALLQERIRDELRAQLPDLVEQVLRERRIK